MAEARRKSNEEIESRLSTLEGKKIQTKILGSDVTSDGAIAALSFSGLIVGEWYEVSGKLRVTATGAELIFVTFSNNAAEVERLYFRIDSAGAINTEQPNFKFQAAGTTLDVAVTGISAGTVIAGDGTRSESYLTIEERPDLVSTTDFS